MTLQYFQNIIHEAITLYNEVGPAREAVSLIRKDQGHRLAIYQGMYRSRVIDSLVEDFPIAQALLGESLFEDICMEYVRRYPSTSYTLEHLGSRFPLFISQEQNKWPNLPYLSDVVKVEQGLNQAVHGALGVEISGSLDLDEGWAKWLDLNLSLASHASLVRCAYDVSSLLQGFRIDEENLLNQVVEKVDTYFLVYRHQDDCYFSKIDMKSHQFLSLFETTDSFGDALDVLLESDPDMSCLKALTHRMGEWLKLRIFMINS